MFEHKTHVRVRYAETDQMGFVYYGHYATYFEVARVETIRALGLTYRKLEEVGVLMPVLELQCKYIKPGRYDDLLTITTQVTESKGSRLFFEYQVHNEAGELLTQAKTTLVFVDAKSGRPQAMPDILADKLMAHL